MYKYETHNCDIRKNHVESFPVFIERYSKGLVLLLSFNERCYMEWDEETVFKEVFSSF